MSLKDQTSPMPISVALVDSQELVRVGLRMAIESHPGLRISSAVGSLEELMDAVDNRLDVIVVNAHLRINPEMLRDISAFARHEPIIILTDRSELDAHYLAFGQAINAGVKGIVFREDSLELFTNAIEQIGAGGLWLDHSVLARVLGKMLQVKNSIKTDPEAMRAAQLTGREREIVALISRGLKNKRVAEQLSLSEASVRHYLTTIFSKLGVADRLELALYAHNNNLTQSSSSQANN